MQSKDNKSSYFNFKRSKSTDGSNQKNKKWVHPEANLINGSVTYCGKYLGDVEVPGAKGMELIKAAAMKLKFSQSLNVSEAGRKKSKLKKIELVVSINSLKVLDMKTKMIIVQRPLHRISYCSDDSTDKRLFAFIAKEQESNNHRCFAFIMEQEACNVTLTLGQAFDIAYKKFCEHGRKQMKETKEILNIKEHEKYIPKTSPAPTNGATNGIAHPSFSTSTPKPNPSNNPFKAKKWATFDEGDSFSDSSSTDRFENYLFGVQQRETSSLKSYNQQDLLSNDSGSFTIENCTLFMDDMSDDFPSESLDSISEDVPQAIAKPPTKREIRQGKKITWDGVNNN